MNWNLTVDDIDPDRLQDFSERLLYTAVRAILKHLKMETSEGTEATDTAEMDVECDTDVLDAAMMSQRQLNTADACLEYWNTCFKKDKLSCLHFREWWRQKVPKYFSPTPQMNYQKPNDHIEEDDVQRNFFGLLERFLTDGDPAVVFQQLAQLNNPPSQCGKVFKIGEPSYSCRDCALDASCVLCVDCFKRSEHGSHRYKMQASGGGGYCDCGDPEAWTQFPSCTIHVAGNQAEGSDPLEKLPLTIHLRARQVFTSVLKYAFELLTLDTMMKLPGDLQCKDRSHGLDPMEEMLEVEDLYATFLYNDEVHTFEEVIHTLTKSVDCDRNQAVSFVSLIDREGRCLVKCGLFQKCNEVRKLVERSSKKSVKALQVKVVHSHVVAHQIFALRLITWLDGILSQSEGFRALFSKILVEQEVGPNGRKQPSILEGMFRKDTVLWKAARTAVHHLLITGMLLENSSKKDLATVFTKNYGDIVKDFIKDDHDHAYSVTILSVQLFTVPSLAQYLIAHQDVLSVLLRTFISECECKKNEKGKLQFDRNAHTAFRRTNYVLIDLRYLLCVPPESFDDNMRRGFLHGYSMLLEVLTWMHGMDSHVRQVTQHIEFEADWENGFNLYIKLAPVVSLVLKWCSMDRIIFVKAIRMLLKKIQTEIENEASEKIQISIDGRWECEVLDYPVASKPVSMHIPLTRLLAGLALSMEKFDITWDSIEVKDCVRPVLEQILELPLRTTVMVSQVYAGLWRRNGFSLHHQIHFYHNARCRGENYDRDIQMLQYCAANLPPELFLLHTLHKFGLTNWAKGGGGDSAAPFELAEGEQVRHMTNMVDEFWALLITLVAERHVPGIGTDVTPDQLIRKEIVQLLCVEPMSNSALNRALPDDPNHETGLEKVIDKVATFKKPNQGSGKGVYELKEECYKEYNTFFYHYTREDQSKSEEVQRARLKAANQQQVVPPPALPGLKPNFRGLLDLMQCDLMLYLIKLVLDRADDLKSKCFSEDQVHRVLYLIGICTQEEQRLKAAAASSSSSYVPAEDAERPFNFLTRAQSLGIVQSLDKLAGSHRIESHKELLAWVTRQMKLSLGLIQTKDISNDGGENSSESSDDVKAAKAKAAQARRAKIMQQMAAQQKSFMKENSRLFDETPSGLREHKISMCDWEIEVESGFPVCVGPNRSQATAMDSVFTCILCQEEEELKSDSRTLVVASFIQKSTVLSRSRTKLEILAADRNQTKRSEPKAMSKEDFPYLCSDLHAAPHTSSCGHVMHSDCWRKYFDDIVDTERKRYRSRHPASFDVEKSEFLCPLCRSLSNSVMTLIPQYHQLQQPRLADESFEAVQAVEAVTSEDMVLAAAPRDMVAASTPDVATDEDMVAPSVAAIPEEVMGATALVTQVVAMETTGDLTPLAQQMVEGGAVASTQPPLSAEGSTERHTQGAHWMELESQPMVTEAIETLVAEVINQAQENINQIDDQPERMSSSSSSSTPTELETSGSITSDSSSTSSCSTFMSADESPKDNFKDAAPGSSSSTNATANNLHINISYSHWLEALFIALKYRRSLSPEKSTKNGGESDPQDEDELRPSNNLVRYYTCPLDQVVTEMESSHHDGGSFARLFTVAEGGELAFPSTVYEIMNTFCQTTYRIGLGEIPHVLDEMIPLMVWQSCSFSIISIVVSAMDTEKPVLGSLSSRQKDCLSTLIRFCGVVGSNFGEPKVIRSHSLKLLSTILEVDTSNPSILELDMFGLLVALTYSLPSLFNGEGAAPLPSCNIQDLHILRLLYSAHITQLLFNRDILSSTKIDFETSVTEKDCQSLVDMLHIVQEPQNVIEDQVLPDPHPVNLWKQIMVNSLGFLRSCALFYQYLSGVTAPTELNTILPPEQEFVLLCRYLSLPTNPRHLLNSDFSLSLVRKWSNHPNVHIIHSQPDRVIPSFTLQAPSLVSLPDDYSELIHSVAGFTCPRSFGEESRAPSMCLVCGEVVCSHSYCCQVELDRVSVGACTAHAHSCCAGAGIFLRVRECKIIMLTGRTRGCFVAAPYLDQYGESDQGLKRGNPLTLCAERYKKLHRIWLNHGISEEVIRNLESSGVSLADWIHL